MAVLGAFAAELAEIDLVRRKAGRLPWNRRKASTVNGQTYVPVLVYLVAVPARLIAAGMVGGVYASANQISGAIGAFTLGAGASLFVSRISDLKDLGDQPHSSEVPLPLQTAKRPSFDQLTLPGGESSAHKAERAENG